MNNAQFQNIFDSVCRCFGHTPNGQNVVSTASGLGVNASVSLEQTNKKPLDESQKKRTSRLGLQDEQWDELFEKKSSRPPKPSSSPVNDLNTAQALAQAKLAANPPRYNRTKRKRPEKAREEIFRSKNPQVDHRASNQTSFTRLLHPSLAMCFATPIRGTDDEPDDGRSIDNSDTITLNTCEDTITSTVYYERKIAHLTETRPPMPLFNQFKIGHQDEIRNIMSKESHSSVNLIRLLQQQQQHQLHQQQQQQYEQQQLLNQQNAPIVGSSHRQTTVHPQPYSQRLSPDDQEMEDTVPDVKAVSDSSGSDGSMRHTSSRRKVYET